MVLFVGEARGVALSEETPLPTVIGTSEKLPPLKLALVDEFGNYVRAPYVFLFFSTFVFFRLHAFVVYNASSSS